MNIRRGLFRLWLVASLLWVAAILAIGWGEVSNDRWIMGDPFWEASALAALPVRCENARGVTNIDYKTELAVEPWNRYRTPSGACWYDEAKFRTFWPEYADTKHFDLSLRLYKSLGWSPTFEGDRYENTKRVAAVALVPPLAVLIVGSPVLWAFAGFRQTPHA